MKEKYNFTCTWYINIKQDLNIVGDRIIFRSNKLLQV